jgi:ABC-type siderophore export system fused ATPase/permease subunit
MVIITAEKILRKARVGQHSLPGNTKGTLTSKGDISQVLDRPRQREYHTDEHTNDAKDDRAGAVVGDCVHHDGKGDNMTAHDKDREQNLAQTE